MVMFKRGAHSFTFIPTHVQEEEVLCHPQLKTIVYRSVVTFTMNTYPLITLCLAALTCALATANQWQTTNNDLFYSFTKNNECEVGPSFWCQNATTARLCDAYEHCKETVWTKQMSSVEGPICEQICPTILNKTKTLLLSRRFQRTIQRDVERICSCVPINIFTTQCMAMSKHIPAAMEYAGQMINVTGTCTFACQFMVMEKLTADFQTTPNIVQEEVYASIKQTIYRLGRNPYIYN